MSVPTVSHDDRGQPVFLGECRVHGWHGRPRCPHCKHVAVEVRQLGPGATRKDVRLIRVSANLVRRRARGKEKLREEGRCRMCLRPRGPDTAVQWLEDEKLGVRYETGSRPLTRHHLVPYRFFRYQPLETRDLANVDANLIPLCRPCHDQVENPDRGVRVEARRMLRRLLGQDEVTFAIQVRGQSWLDAHYPVTGG